VGLDWLIIIVLAGVAGCGDAAVDVTGGVIAGDDIDGMVRDPGLCLIICPDGGGGGALPFGLMDLSPPAKACDGAVE
jgi:hypothetical protein